MRDIFVIAAGVAWVAALAVMMTGDFPAILARLAGAQ